MSLTRVTITGADDETKPEQLVELWHRFPFVEWGILIGSGFGPRFPTIAWIKELIELRVTQTNNNMPLALHVCGRLLRDIAVGRDSLEDELGTSLPAFQRVQLNWHGERQAPNAGEGVLTAFCRLQGFCWDPTLIFQLDGVNDELFEPASRRFACVGLFDRSHGAGTLPGEWPKCRTDIPCGWAGGLGPENLAAELPKIAAQAWPVQDHWVDMETRVREPDDSALDLLLVRKALEISAPFVTVRQLAK